jgi:hypothetical protein
MFGKKSNVQWIIVFLFIFVFLGLIGTPLAQSQNWVAMSPYNLLWPIWSEVLSPVNPLTGLPTPLVSSINNKIVLPEQPVVAWDPSNEFAFFVYNIPPESGGGLIYLYPQKGFQFWPPDYLIDPVTGGPLPLTLPMTYTSLPLLIHKTIGRLS